MSIASVTPSSHLILWCVFFCCQSFPASGTFPMSWLFASGDQNTGASALASVLPMSIQGWFPFKIKDFVWLVWSSCCPRDSQVSSPAPQFEGINSSSLCFLYDPALITECDYWEDHSLDYTDLCWQSDVLLVNTLSRFVIAFLPRSNCLLISGQQSPSTVIDRKSVV